MIRQFGCKNIKAIKEFSEIEIRPITVIMGENSSGKSSLLQALSLLTVNKMFGNDIRRIKYNNPFSNFETVDTFKDKGEDVILTFDVVDDDSIEYRITLVYKDDNLSNEYGLLQRAEIKKVNEFHIELVQNSLEQESYKISIRTIADTSSLLLKYKDKMEIYTNLKIITSIGLNPNSTDTDTDREDIKEDINNIFDSANLLLSPLELLINNIASIRHISMLKDVGASYDYPNDYIGYFGEKYKDIAKSLSSKAYINKCLKNIFQYEIKKIDKDTGDFYLSDGNINKSLKLNMFGSSVSSTIPILTQYAKNRETEIKDKYRLTIIEEPEINEHPLSQAKFIESLFPKNRPKKHFNIIETHSDHIINKLRSIVSKKIIKSSDIVIYYKHKNSTDTIDKNQFYKIEINKCGQFISDEFGKGGFPKGFFDATLDELFMLNNDC